MKVLLVVLSFIVFVKAVPTTDERIAAAGYPVEIHDVETKDGYHLGLFRIAFSNNLQNQNVTKKPAAHLQHGFLCSSDDFILAGNESLAYILADNGYDVWLGNFRGNRYSKGHTNYSTSSVEYWSFDFQHNGIEDLPAMIDYELNVTKQDALHYCGHSMGTTALLVLLSIYPLYVKHFITMNMLAPVAHMNHAKSPLLFALQSLGYPSPLSWSLEDRSLHEYNEVIADILAKVCAPQLIACGLCSNIFSVVAGFDAENTDCTRMSDIAATHPNSGSTNQLMHYLQGYVTGRFALYNYGSVRNWKTYNQPIPPEYALQDIKTNHSIKMRYGDNDYLAAVIDVERLIGRLGDNAEACPVDVPGWNHNDFLWAKNVSEIINYLIIADMQEQEKLR